MGTNQAKDGGRISKGKRKTTLKTIINSCYVNRNRFVFITDHNNSS